jgi:hypothetical protein
MLKNKKLKRKQKRKLDRIDAINKNRQIRYEEMRFPANTDEGPFNSGGGVVITQNPTQQPKKKQGFWGAVWKQITKWGR